MVHPIFLPTLSHWEYGNPWSGELGRARYLIIPSEEQMTAEMWPGPLSREFAQVEHTAQFPISEEGIERLRDWLAEHAAQLNDTNNR